MSLEAPQLFVGRSIPDLDEDSDALSASLAYGRAGLYHGPVSYRTKDPRSTLGLGWPGKTFTDPHSSAEWFAGTDHGVFLHAGRSGLVVFDIDDPAKVPAILREAIRRSAPPYQTTRDPEYTVNGVSRGHYLFENPPGRVFGNSTGGLGKGWGEVRGRNGLIVVAPSIHQHADEGGAYRWRRTGPIPVVPREIEELLVESSGEGGAATDEEIATFYARYTSSNAPHSIEPVLRKFESYVSEGGSRHEAMLSVACWAMREARAGLYPARWAAEQLQGALAAKVGRERDPRAEFAGIASWAVARANDESGERIEAIARKHRPAPRPWPVARAARRATPTRSADEQADDQEGDWSMQTETWIEYPTETVVESPDEDADEGGFVLPESFWTARPALDHIRRAAWARNRSADVVLLSVLARLASMQHHKTAVDGGLGPASLNMMVCAVGPSGSGKTSGIGIARDVLHAPFSITGADGYRDGIPLGSGEGLPELFMGTKLEEHPTETKSDGSPKYVKVRGQVRHNVYAQVDEGEQLFRLAERSGSTLMTTIRSAWVAETIGQANASEETTRIISKGTYSLGVVIGLQPTKAAPLFDDVAGGTPQRFLFATASDPNIPEDETEFPGQLDGQLPCSARTVTVEATIRARLRRDDRAVNTGELIRPELDAHEPLHLLKVSALLALLDGREHVTEDDWALAEQVWETSCRVRDSVVREVRRSVEQVYERMDEREAIRRARVMEVEAEVQDKRLDGIEASAALSVARKAHRDNGASRRDLERAISGKHRKAFGPGLPAAAIERAVASGYIEEKEGSYVPGPVSPPGV